MSRSRLTPIGLSVLVNLALVGLMVCTLSAPRVARERYIAVELRTAPTSNVQRPKPIVQRSAFSVQRGSHRSDKSDRSDLSDHLTMGPRPLAIPHSPSVAGVQQGFTAGGGGTTSTGPGAFAGSGTGESITGSGEGPSTVLQPAPTPNTSHPTPPTQPIIYNPQPTTPSPPKGESRPPSVAKQTKPIYPSDAREDGVEGVSTVLAQLDPEGKVTVTRLEKSSGDRRLDRAALDAVREWTFNPCLRDGVAVKSSVRVKVEFRLE